MEARIPKKSVLANVTGTIVSSLSLKGELLLLSKSCNGIVGLIMYGNVESLMHEAQINAILIAKA